MSSSLAHYGEGAMHLIASQDTAQSVCMRNTLCVGFFSVSLNPFSSPKIDRAGLQSQICFTLIMLSAVRLA